MYLSLSRSPSYFAEPFALLCCQFRIRDVRFVYRTRTVLEYSFSGPCFLSFFLSVFVSFCLFLPLSLSLSIYIYISLSLSLSSSLPPCIRVRVQSLAYHHFSASHSQADLNNRVFASFSGDTAALVNANYAACPDTRKLLEVHRQLDLR